MAATGVGVRARLGHRIPAVAAPRVAPADAPCGQPQAAEEAVLFSYSDRPVQEKLGLFREQRGNA